MIKRTKSNGADSAPQAGESTPTFRDNAEVNAKIDAYIQQNPKYWQYVQSMPRERMERAMVLTKVQQQERQQKLDQGVLRKIEGDPELKQSLQALVKDLPEEQQQNALVRMGSKVLRDIGFFKSRTQQQGGVKV
ncbi:hypothetical protein GCM10023213_32280 [Prosthecobacter algae]|jgi:hypothetical protein|uniref:LTXXQ motif family protein n=1 Tax=Prosthecobacter algae TaxID=1144682 RepID=A0ABP9PB35_9BACT